MAPCAWQGLRKSLFTSSFHSTSSCFHCLVLKTWHSFHGSEKETKNVENTPNAPNLAAAELRFKTSLNMEHLQGFVLVLIPVTHHTEHSTGWDCWGLMVPPDSWEFPNPFTAPTDCPIPLQLRAGCCLERKFPLVFLVFFSEIFG